MEGQIMDPNYSGSFNRGFILSYPPTILSDIHVSVGQSGSPMFLRDPNDDKLKCIGMVNAKLGDDTQFTMGINNNLLRRVINEGINNWFRMTPIEKNSIKITSYKIQDIFPKKWLGVEFQYYNPINPKNNKAFSNFKLNGGIVLTRFILGFNTITKRFVYDYDELAKQGVILLNPPLLDSEMYKKYIYNNRVPIVIKSMKFFDLVNGIYKTFYLGKYKGQYGMDIFTYGFMQMGTEEPQPWSGGQPVRRYGTIIFEYYYYNGESWILTREEIGGTGSDWFGDYFRDITMSYSYQHRYEFPRVLLPYCGTFTKDTIIHDEYFKNAKDGKDGKDGRDARDGKDGKDGRDARDARDAKDAKDARDASYDYDFMGDKR